MGTSDGSVVGVTNIVDHGDPSQRWNLVILGDGYQTSQLNQFHGDVQNFVETMYQTAPYDELWCGINIYRIDVTSTDSGAKIQPPVVGPEPAPRPTSTHRSATAGSNGCSRSTPPRCTTS